VNADRFSPRQQTARHNGIDPISSGYTLPSGAIEAAPGVGVLLAAASPGWIGSKGACEHGQTDPEAPGRCDRERFKKEMANPKKRFMREAADRGLRIGARHRLRLIRIGKRRKLSGISTKPGKKKVSRSAPSPGAIAAQSSSPWLGRRAKPVCDRDLVRRHTATLHCSETTRCAITGSGIIIDCMKCPQRDWPLISAASNIVSTRVSDSSLRRLRCNRRYLSSSSPI
jgi:hypothetical protein